MTIRLYFNHSEDNYIYKTIVPIGSALTGTLKNEMSIMEPEILLEMSLSDFKAYGPGVQPNYIYIDELKRYYFIRDIVSVRSNVIMLKAVEDVLYTYREDIDKISGITERAEEHRNMYLRDADYSLNSFPTVQIVKFDTTGDGLTTSTPILVLGGIS